MIQINLKILQCRKTKSILLHQFHVLITKIKNHYQLFVLEPKAEKIFDVQVCVIGRDPNILQFQQKRVRGQHTTEQALEALEKVWKYKPYMLSMENFYLYRGKYLKRIEEDLDFPIAWNHKVRIDDIANKSSNKKYISDVGEQALDKAVHHAQEES